jgi:hypothetical protein
MGIERLVRLRFEGISGESRRSRGSGVGPRIQCESWRKNRTVSGGGGDHSTLVFQFVTLLAEAGAFSLNL